MTLRGLLLSLSPLGQTYRCHPRGARLHNPPHPAPFPAVPNRRMNARTKKDLQGGGNVPVNLGRRQSSWRGGCDPRAHVLQGVASIYLIVTKRMKCLHCGEVRTSYFHHRGRLGVACICKSMVTALQEVQDLSQPGLALRVTLNEALISIRSVLLALVTKFRCERAHVVVVFFFFFTYAISFKSPTG